MYNDVITLFNRYESKYGDTWYPSILRNVNLNIDKSAIVAKYGNDSQDNAVLNVQFTVNDGKKVIANKIWLPPKEWKLQPKENLSETITFSDNGQKFDFFYLGEWQDETPISDEDYIDGFYDEMNRKHDYVFAITSSAYYNIIPHFEIMAK